jgi:DNA polymerase
MHTKEQALSIFYQEWNFCKECSLHKTASNHVLYRGRIPADILFIGEAPGRTEDILGKPFVGQSGRLLDRLLAETQVTDFLICNILCCVPSTGRKGNPILRQPHPDEVAACLPHVIQLELLCQPKLIVTLGEVAKQHTNKLFPDKERLHLYHPAFILRKGGHNSLEYKITKHTLLKATQHLHHAQA